ncbi:MAG: glycosyltransferase, partial [Treponemataceae bacterium]|nr:glycosyltransferase [Treponemataceae bacterium]
DDGGKRRNREFFLSLCRSEPAGVQGAGTFLDGLSRTGGLASGGSRNAVYFVYQGRIVRQKGISVLLEAAGRLLSRRDDVRFIIAGQGEPELECAAGQFSERHAGRAVYFKGYNKALARLAVASADFAVLPSNFEPCCLEDFIAQIYGTIPVAHETGGLRKIIDGRTGFLYRPNSAEALEEALQCAAERLLHEQGRLVRMVQDSSAFVRREYSWDAVIRKKYLTFFENLLQSD